MKQVIISLLALIWLGVSHNFADQTQGCFDGFQEKGSAVIFNHTGGKWYFTNSMDATCVSLPTSNFKIINLAIAKELCVIEDGMMTFTDKGNHKKYL